MPTAASGAYIANSNGKRPHGALTNGAEEDEVENMPNVGKPVKTHHGSGYRWARAEDEPGYSWSNKKAFDEMNKAWEGLVHKDAGVKGGISPTTMVVFACLEGKANICNF